MPLFPYLTLAYGAYQTIKAEQELNKLSKEPIPEYGLSASSKALVDLGNYGYTPQETAAFYDQLNKNESALYRTTMERVGNTFAGSAFAAINAKKFSAISQFISNDANLHRSNLKTAAAIDQSIKNKNTEVLVKDYFGRQSAWGKSEQAGINNTFLGIASMGDNASTTDPNKAFTSMFSDNPAKAAMGAVVGGANADKPVANNPVKDASWVTAGYKLDNGVGGTYIPDVGYKSKDIMTEGVSKTSKSNYGNSNLDFNFNDYGAIFNY